MSEPKNDGLDGLLVAIGATSDLADRLRVIRDGLADVAALEDRLRGLQAETITALRATHTDTAIAALVGVSRQRVGQLANP